MRLMTPTPSQTTILGYIFFVQIIIRCLHGLAKFSQNEEMRVALENTGAHRLAKASLHDNVWGIGLNACDPLAVSPASCHRHNLLGQAIECARGILRQDSPRPSGDTRPEILSPRGYAKYTV